MLIFVKQLEKDSVVLHIILGKESYFMFECFGFIAEEITSLISDLVKEGKRIYLHIVNNDVSEYELWKKLTMLGIPVLVHNIVKVEKRETGETREVFPVEDVSSVLQEDIKEKSTKEAKEVQKELQKMHNKSATECFYCGGTADIIPGTFPVMCKSCFELNIGLSAGMRKTKRKKASHDKD